MSSSLQRLWVPHGLNDNLEFILIDPSAADFDDDTFFDYVDNYDSWFDRVYRFWNSLHFLAPKHFSKKIKLCMGRCSVIRTWKENSAIAASSMSCLAFALSLARSLTLSLSHTMEYQS